MFSHKKVNVLWGKLENNISSSRLDALVNQLPSYFHPKILRHRKNEDIQASAIGKLLLLDGLRKIYGMEADVIDSISYSKYNKPYLREKSIDFNISHSSDLVVCVFCSKSKVGVDIEKIRPVNIQDFRNVFSNQEMSSMSSAQNRFQAFFNLWTKKEALLKGEGIGLNFPLDKISFEHGGDECYRLTNKWFLRPIHLHDSYCCWLATTKKVSDAFIEIQQTPFRA